MLRVREPRTGMQTDHTSWSEWRARWMRRPMRLRHRVRRCPWCWAFGALELTRAGEVVCVPCLACGRVGAP